MKNLPIILLALLIVISLANLLTNFGLIGGGGSDYKVVTGEEMDRLGFRSVAAEAGIPISEEGEISFPQEMSEKLIKSALLPRSIKEIAKDGGWQLIGVTADNHYIFSR
jgi:hypothetical protein